MLNKEIIANILWSGYGALILASCLLSFGSEELLSAMDYTRLIINILACMALYRFIVKKPTNLQPLWKLVLVGMLLFELHGVYEIIDTWDNSSFIYYFCFYLFVVPWFYALFSYAFSKRNQT